MITERSIHAYLEALSAHEPTPGGGSVAALVGALAAGLGVMVANFTLGRKKYASVSAEVEERLANLSQALQVLEDLVQEDIDAYGAVGRVLRCHAAPMQSKQRVQGTDPRGLSEGDRSALCNRRCVCGRMQSCLVAGRAWQ